MSNDNLPQKFTKKPVTISAIQWTGDNLRAVICFTDGPPDVRGNHAAMKWEEYNDLVAREGLKIFTLEGKMSADVGDWIIKGVKGEHYPCKPDIFAMTYEAGQRDAVAASGAGVPEALTVIRDLDKISIELAARLASMASSNFKGHDYLWRDSVMHEVVAWREQWDKNSAARPDFAAQVRALAAAPTHDCAAGLLKEALAWIENSKEPAPSLCGDIRKFLDLPSQPTKAIEPQSGLLFEALNDMARIRSEHDKNIALGISIDRQIKNVEEQLRKRNDRRLLQIDVEFERRVNSEDRRANARKQFKER